MNSERTARRALVIGAASGIGREVARLLGADHELIVADLDVDTAGLVATELGVASGHVHRVDLADRSSIDALLDVVGTVDAVALTAGISATMGSGETVIDIDLVAVAHLVERLPPMLAPGGVAVLTASIAAHLTSDDAAIDRELDRPLDPDLVGRLRAAGAPIDDPALAYMLAKRGVIRLVRRTAAAWGRDAHRLVSVSPGIVDTPMGRAEMDAQPAMPDMVAATPIDRMAHPAEIAEVIAFAARPTASFLTGTDLLVDGGFMASLA